MATPTRWTLSRAGIVNVYQYEQETLHFAGGRLLLRGVNGSGKSTAMNMLLPFLIDADPRRIDAAGQQTGVLASWMLSGRDDPQPIGYLWLEFQCGDAYFVCGCGIRASQRTQRVTTWWFTTDQRPGIDVALVEHGVPRTADSLRATLGAGAVHSEDQRAAYRAEVRRRLFGGADLEQHIGLLHIVRSPRVGDQIDRDLPDHLIAALPELSESAVADAAQPLDDLDDHRRNVEELTRTAAGLAALTVVYQRYARSELRRRAAAAGELVDAASRRRRTEQEASRTHAAAVAAREAASARVVDLSLRQRTLDTELIALRESPAYQHSHDLVAMRGQVQSLSRQVTVAEARVDRHADARAGTVRSATDALDTVRTDLDELRHGLDGLGSLVTATRLPERPPDAPAVEVLRIDGEVDGPAAPLEVEPLLARLTAVRTAAQQRTLDVATMRAARAAVEAAERELADARRRLATADRVAATADERHADARRHFDRTAEAWTTALDEWVEGMRLLDPDGVVAGVHERELPPPAELVERRGPVLESLRDLLNTVADTHAHERAILDARAAQQRAAVADAEAVLAELEARAEPEPPRTTWQRASGARPRLAEVIDFKPGLSPTEQAGLEAALEAAGLLGAELALHPADGAAAHGTPVLVLESGELLAVGGAAVADPLSDLLTVTVPAAHGTLDPAAIVDVLASISTATSGPAGTAVGTDGTFRIGALHGRHHKDVAEHIGTTARRERLERQRTEARLALASARSELAATDARLVVVADHVLAVAEHRRAEPSVRAVDLAEQQVVQAELRLAEARVECEERRRDVATADEQAAEAAADLHRKAATLHLPIGADELQSVAEQLAGVGGACDQCRGRAGTAVRAHGTWSTSIATWRAAAAEHAASIAAHADLISELEPLRMRLATLEDAIGLDVDEVLRAVETSERDLESVVADLAGARDDELARATDLAGREAELTGARDARAAADAACVHGIGVLRAALAVPGLVAAAQIDPSAPLDLAADEAVDRLPTVEESVDGLRALASAVLAQIPEPSEGESTADGVRLSLRARRDQLAAGWDAEDRQPDPELPLTVDVVGPAVGRVALAEALTRVTAQLRDQEGLLTQKQNQALRNLLQGLIAREVAERLHAATELVGRINARLLTVQTSHGVGVKLRWRQRDDLDPGLARVVGILAKLPDLRSEEEEQELAKSLSAQLDEARRVDGEASYRELIGRVLDYRQWFEMSVLVRRAGSSTEQRLTRRTPLSEGEKKLVTYLPLFAAVAASCDGLGRDAGGARFLVLDDAFAKVSEDNHAGLFGLLVEFDLDFIATSERLWGTHDTVPDLAVTEVIRDADLGVIMLEHFTWDGRTLRQGHGDG